jgi:hypothetical protein
MSRLHSDRTEAQADWSKVAFGFIALVAVGGAPIECPGRSHVARSFSELGRVTVRNPGPYPRSR